MPIRILNSGFFWGLFLTTHVAFAGIAPHSIPRNPGKPFSTEGLFEGGKDVGANLENLRVANHAKDGFERWVIDFSDLAKNLGASAPLFQIRYEKADKVELPEGGDLIRRPAHFIFVFRQIQKNNLTEEKIQQLVKKSRFVKEILLYPPIEKGDMAMEFVLHDNVRFTPHQPMEKEGRLVLDLKKLK